MDDRVCNGARMKRAALLALVATACSTLASCSWVFSRPPDRTQPFPMCQPGYVAPAIDTHQAVGSGLLTLFMLSETEGSQADTMGTLAAITGGLTALWAASAHYGFKNARKCRELRNELAQAPRMPPTWVAPSVPVQPQPSEDIEMPEVEQHVDVDEDQIDIHTTIRKPKPKR
jgi:hypothetical protein